MLTEQEVGFTYNVFDEISMKGLENKIMIVNIMKKLALMLKELQEEEDK